MSSTVLLPSRMQVRLNVIGMNGFEVDATFSYVMKEISRFVCVIRNDRKAEISLPHVLTQCDKRVIADVLLGNTGLLRVHFSDCGNAKQDSYLCAGKRLRKQRGHGAPRPSSA